MKNDKTKAYPVGMPFLLEEFDMDMHNLISIITESEDLATKIGNIDNMIEEYQDNLQMAEGSGYFDALSEIRKLQIEREHLLHKINPQKSTDEDIEIGRLMNAIKSTEDQVYREIAKQETISKALGSKERTTTPLMQRGFNAIEKYIQRIEDIRSGSIDLAAERKGREEEERLNREREKHREDQDVWNQKYKEQERNYKNKFFRQKFPQPAPERFYLEAIPYDKKDWLQGVGKNDSLKFDPYVKRWYSNPYDGNKHKFSPEISKLMLSPDKNKYANEWSRKIRYELENLPPEERELTKKIHKTPIPAFIRSKK